MSMQDVKKQKADPYKYILKLVTAEEQEKQVLRYSQNIFWNIWKLKIWGGSS